MCIDRWIDKKIWLICITKYYSALLINEGNPHVCNDMDESGKHYAKMKQARQREKYGTVPITCMWNPKIHIRS